MPALIITLTLNPALDLATTTDHVAPTHKLRCGPVRRFAGGGGINVARVLHRLGADVCAWALAGGAAGAQVQRSVKTAGSKVGVDQILVLVGNDIHALATPAFIAVRFLS